MDYGYELLFDPPDLSYRATPPQWSSTRRTCFVFVASASSSLESFGRASRLVERTRELAYAFTSKNVYRAADLISPPAINIMPSVNGIKEDHDYLSSASPVLASHPIVTTSSNQLTSVDLHVLISNMAQNTLVDLVVVESVFNSLGKQFQFNHPSGLFAHADIWIYHAVVIEISNGTLPPEWEHFVSNGNGVEDETFRVIFSDEDLQQFYTDEDSVPKPIRGFLKTASAVEDLKKITRNKEKRGEALPDPNEIAVSGGIDIRSPYKTE